MSSRDEGVWNVGTPVAVRKICLTGQMESPSHVGEHSYCQEMTKQGESLGNKSPFILLPLPSVCQGLQLAKPNWKLEGKEGQIMQSTS